MNKVNKHRINDHEFIDLIIKNEQQSHEQSQQLTQNTVNNKHRINGFKKRTGYKHNVKKKKKNMHLNKITRWVLWQLLLLLLLTRQSLLAPSSPVRRKGKPPYSMPPYFSFCCSCCQCAFAHCTWKTALLIRLNETFGSVLVLHDDKTGRRILHLLKMKIGPSF